MNNCLNVFYRNPARGWNKPKMDGEKRRGRWGFVVKDERGGGRDRGDTSTSPSLSSVQEGRSTLCHKPTKPTRWGQKCSEADEHKEVRTWSDEHLIQLFHQQNHGSEVRQQKTSLRLWRRFLSGSGRAAMGSFVWGCVTDFFTYETTKSVVVKSWSVGIINRIVQVLIIAYFAGSVFELFFFYIIIFWKILCDIKCCFP